MRKFPCAVMGAASLLRPLAMAAAVLALLAGVSACGGTGIAGSGSPPVSHLPAQDRSWLNRMHQADLAEVEAGQVAEDKGGSAAIRSAGATLARDHTTFDATLVRAAQALKSTLPDYLTEDQASSGERIGTEMGHKFDHDFVAVMMTGHQRLIALTKTELSHGRSLKVVALAKQALPMLEKHLRMLQTAAPTG